MLFALHCPDTLASNAVAAINASKVNENSIMEIEDDDERQDKRNILDVEVETRRLYENLRKYMSIRYLPQRALECYDFTTKIITRYTFLQ